MAMNNLAVAYTEGWGVEPDFVEAARWFTEAAKLGLAVAQFNLAVLYERGAGVRQSFGEAYTWYAIAARHGDGLAEERMERLAAGLNPDELAAARVAADAFVAAPLDRAANAVPALVDILGD